MAQSSQSTCAPRDTVRAHVTSLSWKAQFALSSAGTVEGGAQAGDQNEGQRERQRKTAWAPDPGSITAMAAPKPP